MNYLLNLNRFTKQAIQVISDILIINICLLLAVAIDTGIIYFNSSDIINILRYSIFLIPFSILIFYLIKIYENFVRDSGFQIVRRLILSSITSGIFLFIINNIFQYYSFRISLIYLPQLIIFTIGLRLLFKFYILSSQNNRENILIFGAGEAGRRLLTLINFSKEFSPQGFIDDSYELKGKLIDSLKVFHSDELENIIIKKKINKVLIAIPSAKPQEKQNIFNRLEKLNISCQTVPDLRKIVLGEAKINELNSINVEEIISRHRINSVSDKALKVIKNKNILITGAGGSIGSEIVKKIIFLKPKKILLFEISEFALYKMNQEINQIIINNKLSDTQVLDILGSIQNKTLVNKILEKHHINIIFHAAAYKHVPLLENNVVEAVKNNIFGTKVIAESAIKNKVDILSMISTDKAVNPSNIMGSTKRIAELICQQACQNQKHTSLSIVRFGNVVGSSGSVVPLFQKQIEDGGPVTITHKDVTRYLMSITEAAILVIEACTIPDNDEICFLEMGEPIKILDLAIKMIKLKGLNYNMIEKTKDNKETINIRFTGLRPGEKLNEELHISNQISLTENPLIKKVFEKKPNINALNSLLDDLEKESELNNSLQLRELLNISF